MTPDPLPRPIAWVIRLVVPPGRAAGVLADLEDDYSSIRSSRPGVPAWLWLVRESASLAAAYLLAPLGRLKGSRSMWLRDVHLVARGLRRRPLAALAAAAMLSVGLLAVLVTAALSETLLFRPVSAAHGDAVRRLASTDQKGATSYRMSFPELQLVRERLGDAGTLTFTNLQPVVARAHGVDVQTMAEVVDGEYFAVTGSRTTIGRGLVPGDDRPGSPPVVVIAESLWRARFGASPAVLSETLRLNGTPYAVIGVAANLGSSSFLGASVDAWVPAAHADALLNRGWRTDIANRWFTTYVWPSASLADVERRLAVAAADLSRLDPDRWVHRRLQTAPGVVLAGSQRATARRLAAILGAFALLILTVAAANVGGLLFARVAAERRQAAIHLSLGAGRGALARRLLIEGIVLGSAAACLALAQYMWARTWFAEIALLPTLALRLDLPFDGRFAGLVAAAGAGTGLLLAVAPAVWAGRVDPARAMQDGGSRTMGGRGVARARRTLVSAQVCLSLVLIVGAALFIRSLHALSTVDVGFNRDRLLALDFDVEPATSPTSGFPRLAREALQRVAAIPGVTGAAMSNRAPIDQSTPAVEVRGPAGAAAIGETTMYLATPGYFDTLGLPLVAGRPFTQFESDTTADVAIVNETLARRLWPRGDAIERPLYLPGEGKTLRIVGIARDSKYRELSEAPRPHVYRPTPPALGLTLLARSSGDPYDALRAIQRTLDGVGPGLVGFFPRTLEDHVAIELLPTRAAAGAATGLGVLALALSSVGLYGTVAWFVELRRREIGVRMALGATSRDVRGLVVRQALGMALPGFVAGLLLTGLLAVAARSALFGVPLVDPLAVGAGIAALAIVLVSGSYLPSRRATRVDPAATLRQ